MWHRNVVAHFARAKMCWFFKMGKIAHCALYRHEEHVHYVTCSVHCAKKKSSSAMTIHERWLHDLGPMPPEFHPSLSLPAKTWMSPTIASGSATSRINDLGAKMPKLQNIIVLFNTCFKIMISCEVSTANMTMRVQCTCHWEPALWTMGAQHISHLSIC